MYFCFCFFPGSSPPYHIEFNYCISVDASWLWYSLTFFLAFLCLTVVIHTSHIFYRIIPQLEFVWRFSHDLAVVVVLWRKATECHFHHILSKAHTNMTYYCWYWSWSLGQGSALVCYWLPNKVWHIQCLKQQKCIFSQFWGLEVQDHTSADSVPSKGSEGESVPCLFPTYCWFAGNLVHLLPYRHISPISALIFLCDIESKAWTPTHQISVVLFSAIRKNSKRDLEKSPIPHIPAILPIIVRTLVPT